MQTGLRPFIRRHLGGIGCFKKKGEVKTALKAGLVSKENAPKPLESRNDREEGGARVQGENRLQGKNMG